MDIIARFPRLPPLDDLAPAASHAESHRPAPRTTTCRRLGGPATRHRPPAFPTVSVAVLAAVAAVAWSLAAWHESVRLASQQRPDRLALQPPSAVQSTAAAPTPTP